MPAQAGSHATDVREPPRFTRAEARRTMQPRALRGVLGSEDLWPRRRPRQPFRSRHLIHDLVLLAAAASAAAHLSPLKTPRRARGWIVRARLRAHPAPRNVQFKYPATSSRRLRRLSHSRGLPMRMVRYYDLPPRPDTHP